ncbi:hypothetical protein HJFPF1_12478 [Paramyrothecium foliicola]|nr:hypothetical protein HJFPF1_12478 [Paramyrothecium foliicola]
MCAYAAKLRSVSRVDSIDHVRACAAFPDTDGTLNRSDLDPKLLVAIPAMWVKGVSSTGAVATKHLYKIMPRLILMDLVRTGTTRLDWLVMAQMSIEATSKAYRRLAGDQNCLSIAIEGW